MLHWRSWGEGYVLFNEGSGQTHFLNELGAAVLRLVWDSTSDVDSLCEQLCSEYGLAVDAELESSVAGVLEDLNELGLIQPCII